MKYTLWQGLFIAALLCFTTLASPFIAIAADFYVVQNPASLSLLDRFQQNISNAQKKELASGTPFCIKQKNELMGDELTQAHRVTYKGKILFMALNDAGEIAGNESQDNVTLYRGCTLYNDSIQVQQSNILSMRKKLGTTIFYEKDILIRHFSHADKFYITHNASKNNGWVSLKKKRAWGKIAHTKKAPTPLLGALTRDRIGERIEEVNIDYRQYTTFFNKQTGDTKAPPQWILRPVGAGFTCTWKGSSDHFAAMKRSTRILLADLANMVLGKPFAVILKNRTIYIKVRKN